MWTGVCNLWVDYVRLDDKWAHNLFDKNALNFLSSYYKEKLDSEATAFGDRAYAFYVDEMRYNNLPAMKFIQNFIKDSTTSKARVTALYFPSIYNGLRRDTSLGIKRELKKGTAFIDSLQPPVLLSDIYTLNTGDRYAPSERKCYFPPNLTAVNFPTLSYLQASTNSQYNTSLQRALGDKSTNYDVTDNLYTFSFIPGINKCSKEAKSKGIKHIPIIQAHSFLTVRKYTDSVAGGLREPTTQEINVLAFVALSHGAQGLLYEAYQTPDTTYSPPGMRGSQPFINFDFVTKALCIAYADSPSTGPGKPVRSNYYGQNKFSELIKLNKKLEKIGEVIKTLDWQEGYSVHHDGANHYFISDIKSIYRNPSSPYAFSPSNDDGTKYWEEGFFNSQDASDKSKYFMMVNRRCVPEINNDGDLRQLKIKFDSAQLSGFRNWKVIDLDSNKVIRTFDKDSNIYVDLGVYQPGEGKLYKLAPVMQEGGTLVTDEDCGGFEFDCKGEVNNNGNNINIKPGTIINFTNDSARIIMTDEIFTIGVNPPEDTSRVYLKGKGGSNFWQGLLFNSCDSVVIAKTYFENISPYPVDSTYAVDLINCPEVIIYDNSFTADLDIKTGAIRVSYTTTTSTPEVYICNNYFLMDAGEMPAVSVVSSGSVTFPLLIEGNDFESYSGNSSNAIFLSLIVGGAIKSNTIANYKNSIILLYCSVDIYGNYIDGSDDNSEGIMVYASNANLAPSGNVYTGGLNTIFTEGEEAKCMELITSYLWIDNGYNTFDLKNYDPPDAYHLIGRISNESEINPYEATHNCFRASGSDTDVIHDVQWIDELFPINFDFEPYTCNQFPPDENMAYYLGGGMYDSIYCETEGSGSGKSNIKLPALPSGRQISDYKLEESDDKNQSVEKINKEDAEIISLKCLEDSISINLRKRDYEKVSDFCYELFTDYIDSLHNENNITKLYLSELRLDSSGDRISNLKSFLENLILNSSEKELLIKNAFYFIQKCKVSLGMYESAMEGFQQIVNENPYSYEGLVASWDFSATSLLLDGQNGSSGGISNYQFSMYNEEPISDEETSSDFFNDDPNDKYDGRKFTKENRKEIKKNVLKTFKTGREKETERIKDLEEKVRNGNSTKKEKDELKTKKILKDVIKVKKPNTNNGACYQCE